MAGFNALMFATVLYRARLVPRLIPAMGLVGAPMLIASTAGIMLGLHELGSVYSAVATVPIFVWELSVGLWMTFKGFNRKAPILASGSTDEVDEVDGAGGGSRVTGVAPRVAAPAITIAAAPARFARLRLRRRHLLIVLGLWISVVASAEAQARGVGIALVILFAIAPRLPLLLGIRQPKAPGHLAKRVVPLFNVTHEPLLPLVVFGLGVAGILPAVWLVGGLAWLGQLVIDWGIGDGLREKDGSLRPAPSRWTSWPAVAAGSRDHRHRRITNANHHVW